MKNAALMSDLVDDTRRGDRDLALWPTGIAALLLNLLDDVHALNDFTKHNVLSIKPRSHDCRNEELHRQSKVRRTPWGGTTLGTRETYLRAVRVGSSVCHG